MEPDVGSHKLLVGEGPADLRGLSLCFTNWIASPTEAGIGGRVGGSPGDGSSAAGDGSFVVAAKGSSAAGLDEGMPRQRRVM